MSTKSATEIDRDLGQGIAVLRKAKRLSQTTLGAAIGISFQQIQKYEKGMNRVSGSRRQELAHALDVPVSALFGERVAVNVGVDVGKIQGDVFESLAEVGAVELLLAYSAIKDGQLQRDVLALINIVARIGARPVAGNA